MFKFSKTLGIKLPLNAAIHRHSTHQVAWSSASCFENVHSKRLFSTTGSKSEVEVKENESQQDDGVPSNFGGTYKRANHAINEDRLLKHQTIKLFVKWLGTAENDELVRSIRIERPPLVPWDQFDAQLVDAFHVKESDFFPPPKSIDQYTTDERLARIYRCLIHQEIPLVRMLPSSFENFRDDERIVALRETDYSLNELIFKMQTWTKKFCAEKKQKTKPPRR